MTEKKNMGRAEWLRQNVSPKDINNGEPIELPLGTRIPKVSIEKQIQDQIAIQIAKKTSGAY